MDGFSLLGATAAHPIANNHFGTTRLNSAIAVLALKYKTAFANGPELGINDQSLEEGGLFDIGPPLGKFWEPPHKAHRFGVDVDINLIPPKRLVMFQQMARAAGFIIFIAEGDHYHLRVAGGPQ